MTSLSPIFLSSSNSSRTYRKLRPLRKSRENKSSSWRTKKRNFSLHFSRNKQKLRDLTRTRKTGLLSRPGRINSGIRLRAWNRSIGRLSTNMRLSTSSSSTSKWNWRDFERIKLINSMISSRRLVCKISF